MICAFTKHNIATDRLTTTAVHPVNQAMPVTQTCAISDNAEAIASGAICLIADECQAAALTVVALDGPAR
jgi:hypothetical protein